MPDTNDPDDWDADESGNAAESGPADYGLFDDEEDDESEDNDFGFDDEDDDYSDFESGPGTGGGIKRFAIRALALLLLAGIGIVAVQAVRESSGPSDSTTTTTAAAAAENIAPPEVLDAMRAGLTAWGKFAATGDLDVVRPHFVADGPQFERFEAEAPEFAKQPSTTPPLTMELTDPRAVKVNDNIWLITGTLRVTQPGGQIEEFPRELRLIRSTDKSPWQILAARSY